MFKFIEKNITLVLIWTFLLLITVLSGYTTYVKSADFSKTIHSDYKSIDYSIQKYYSNRIQEPNIDFSLDENEQYKARGNQKVYTSIDKLQIINDGTATASESLAPSSASNFANANGDRTIISATLKVADKEYTAELTDPVTVYEMMDKTRRQTDFTFESRNHDYLGHFITAINGTLNDKKTGRFWIYYVNGEKARIGISNRILKNNDIIEWKYEKDTSVHF